MSEGMDKQNDVIFSVIMPIYLRESSHWPTVEKAISSVLNFSRNFEFIIVNDGSPLNDYSFETKADVYIRHNKNKGIAPSWNDGMKIAKGEYIAIINDDIEACPDWLEGMKMALDKIENSFVAAPAVEHMPRKQGIMEDKIWFPGSCFMLKRKTINEIGYFDEQFVPFNCEDIDYWYRIFLKGGKMARNYDVFIKHKEGDVLHKLNYQEVDNENIEKLISKWGTDPRTIFYEE